MDATHNYFGTLRMALISVKPEKDCPFLLVGHSQSSSKKPRTKAPVPWLRKMITETSLLPLNTLITSVKESNN
jgi:hypothetical protein